ncbi:MAG: DNA-directed RNA polymerase subunit beta', partial [Pelagibacterales bacterium]|nr:DNA-directed RNA polymerase subunit beta' [Pelagibacterales bacterium]
MMATNNILSSANGEPIIVPSQDIILGLYYLSSTIQTTNEKYFINENNVEKALLNKELSIHTKIYIKKYNKFIKTTPGRLILYKIIPKNINFETINKAITKKDISDLIKISYKTVGLKETILLADELMYAGFKYATQSGISIGINDMYIPKEKKRIIKNAENEVNEIEIQYSSGLITKDERYNKIIDIWSDANENIANEMMKNLSMNTFNPIYIMSASGARGSVAQMKQLSGMRGLMAKPDGSIIETPITANFREGLNVLQYFISTHGARKGLSDTAIKAANAGYLTRRLVDVAQDVVTTNFDCNTENGITISTIIEGGDIVESLKTIAVGRTILENIYDKNNQLIIEKNTLLTEKTTEKIENLNIEKIKIRSPITCETQHGICTKCYGSDLSNGKLINIGDAVGVIAAQSIGEPGTLLTMRTFHIGGAASSSNISNFVQSRTNGTIELKNIKLVKNNKSKILISVSRSGIITILDINGKEKERYKIPYGAIIKIKEDKTVKIGDNIAEWDPHNHPIISEIEGKIKYIDLIEGITVNKQTDEITGLSNIVVTNIKQKTSNYKDTKPTIKIIQNNDEKNPATYFLPPDTIINVKNNQKVNIGDVIAKIPQETSKIKDITGGLPRVADLFEARKPKDSAVLAEISGKVIFGKETKGKRRLIITNNNEEQYEILIPKWRNINIFENENINKGEILIDGQYNPHDILRLLGIDELTNHIKREVQNIYRLQGVKINDKHIEIIIRQMSKKVLIKNNGDSDLIIGEQENIHNVRNINKKLQKENKNIIEYEQILLGITKASLSTESFISAASFQETTKILTEAAINGKKDKLLGLKENVIVGKLIPAGTGFYQKKLCQ